VLHYSVDLRRFTDKKNVHGTGSVKIWKTRHIFYNVGLGLYLFLYPHWYRLEREEVNVQATVRLTTQITS